MLALSAVFTDAHRAAATTVLVIGEVK